MAENINKVETPWDITAKRYVGFIDIMGFKDMVSRSTHDEIYEMMKNIEAAKNQNEKIEWGNSKEQLVRSTFYSDSIMLYSKDDSYGSVDAMLYTLSAFTNDLLVLGIPHKGALAFGNMTLDTERSIFFGQPLIDAYLLQEELSLYCIVIHSSAEGEIERQSFKHLLFHDYICPFKGGASKHLIIPPIFAGASPNGTLHKWEQELKNGIKALRHKTSGHLRKYIDNTEAFLKSYEEKQAKQIQIKNAGGNI